MVPKNDANVIRFFFTELTIWIDGQRACLF
jgi:hypothetical protein